jgi:hypothetical protein
MFVKSFLITEQPIGASPLPSYPGQTTCSSVWTLFQARVHRKYNEFCCGEKAWKIPLWFTINTCIQAKLVKHPHHIFLSSLSVMSKLNDNSTGLLKMIVGVLTTCHTQYT